MSRLFVLRPAFLLRLASARSVATLIVASVAITGCASSAAQSESGASSSTNARGAPKVGPLHGSVLVVGGGAQGPEVFAKFIELAGGPDALIVEVPTAGGDSIDISTVGRGLRSAGARNVVVLHTTSKSVADADSFVAKIANARGVWFGGGRHYRLVDSYAGTKTQRAFEAVLARGGVVGGSSAGASILGDYLVRGAPSNDNRIMSHPQYLKGFAYLRNVAIDQHVVARDRLPDMHDSVTSTHPGLLGISEDEGTVWVVRGDTAEIIGRNKAFVYNGRDRNDNDKPFLTLHPGDRYNLATRRVMSRAIDATPLTMKFIDDLFYSKFARGTPNVATVLVAQNGKVLVDKAYGIPVQRRFLPETGAPLFPLLGLSEVLNAAAATTLDNGNATNATSGARRVLTIGGMQRVRVDSGSGGWVGDVDDLYRFEQGRFMARLGGRDTVATRGFTSDQYRAVTRLSAYGTRDGRRNAYVRFPDSRTAIIILSNDDKVDVRDLAQRIADRLLFAGK